MYQINDEDVGRYLAPEVKNVIKLSLAFAKAAANNQFDKEDNLVLSTYNALTALSMVAKAAGTETREELAQTLFGVSADALDAEVTKLTSLNADVLEYNKDKVTLKTANAVWTNDELMALNQSYANELKKDFGADISGEKFSDPAVVKKINQWASDNTNGLIDNIVKELPGDQFAVLASALYFKGDWIAPFEKELTADAVFTSDGAKSAMTKLMNKNVYETGEFTYQDGSDFEAVALNYGADDRASMRMVLVRPKGDISARDWLSAQAGDAVPRFLDQSCFERAIGHIGVPLMDIKQKHNLIPVLKDTGVKAAFDGSAADFRKMAATGEKGLYIGEVTQDIVFKTDEKGSEAAAVTQVGVFLESCIMPSAKEIDIDFDRSFVLAVQDLRTGLPLFIGAVNKPNQEMKAIKAPTP